jgi:hypothetical protein
LPQDSALETASKEALIQLITQFLERIVVREARIVELQESEQLRQ